jgi:Domain of unknown function (DUF4279)
VTSLRLKLQLRGPNLDPTELTRLMGIEPSRSFGVGEARAPGARGVAVWSWQSDPASETGQIQAELLRLFSPHVAMLRSRVETGASTLLSVVGHAGGIVVSSAEQAEARRVDWDYGAPFKPFFDGDRVEFYLAPEVIAFAAAIGASIDTYIDFELQDDRPNWWEPDSQET